MKSFRKMLTDSRSGCRSLPASDPARTKIQKSNGCSRKQTEKSSIMPTSDRKLECTFERDIDTVMKNTKNQDYYAMPSIRATGRYPEKIILKDWKSHFELYMASYRQNPENLRHSQSSRDISGHLTRPLPLPIRLQSGLISKEKCTSHFFYCLLPL